MVYMGTSLCRLCESSILGSRAGFCTDTSNTFPQSALAIISMIGGVVGCLDLTLEVGYPWEHTLPHRRWPLKPARPMWSVNIWATRVGAHGSTQTARGCIPLSGVFVPDLVLSCGHRSCRGCAAVGELDCSGADLAQNLSILDQHGVGRARGLLLGKEMLHTPAQSGSSQDLVPRGCVSVVPRVHVLTTSAAAARHPCLLLCPLQGSPHRPRTTLQALWAALRLLDWVLFPGLPAWDSELNCCMSRRCYWCAGWQACPVRSHSHVWADCGLHGLARIILRGSGLSASRRLLRPDFMPSCNVEHAGLHFPVQGFLLLGSGKCVKTPVSLCPAWAHSLRTESRLLQTLHLPSRFPSRIGYFPGRGSARVNLLSLTDPSQGTPVPSWPFFIFCST